MGGKVGDPRPGPGLETSPSLTARSKLAPCTGQDSVSPPSRPARRRHAEGRGPRGAAPRGCALGRADDITGPGAGRERERESGPPPRQAQRPVGLGPAAAAMTQGPGGRAPPAPPAPPEPEAPTTFCALLPRMPQWKFAAPAGFLGRGPAAARAAGGAGAAGGADPPAEPAGPASVPALAAAVLGACEPRCAAPCPLPTLSRCRTAGTRGSRGARGTAGAPDAAADEWIRKGSFIHKPAHGWLHPDARVLGPGVSYIVRVSAPAGSAGVPSSDTSTWGLGLPSPTSFSRTPRTLSARCLLSILPSLPTTPGPHLQPDLRWAPPAGRRWGRGSHGVTCGEAGRGPQVGGGHACADQALPPLPPPAPFGSGGRVWTKGTRWGHSATQTPIKSSFADSRIRTAATLA